MKEKSRKFARYTTAAAALLAVSGGANAAIIPGKITSNGSDNTLRSEGDEIYVDINNDGIDDLVGLVRDSFYNYSSSLSGSGFSYKNFMFGSYTTGNMVELSYGPYIKKFSFNDAIGPLSNSDRYGIVSVYSGGDFPPPPPAPGPVAPAAPFLSSDDVGYIGVSFEDEDGIKYGWVQVQISEEGDEVSFLACALEQTPEQPILAGNGTAVPLLPIASAAGLGLIGLFAAMKRRKKLTA